MSYREKRKSYKKYIISASKHKHDLLTNNTNYASELKPAYVASPLDLNQQEAFGLVDQDFTNVYDQGNEKFSNELQADELLINQQDENKDKEEHDLDGFFLETNQSWLQTQANLDCKEKAACNTDQDFLANNSAFVNDDQNDINQPHHCLHLNKKTSQLLIPIVENQQQIQISKVNTNQKLRNNKEIKKFQEALNKSPWYENFRLSRGLLLTIPYLLLTILLLVIPIAAIIVKSFVPIADPEVGQTTVADNWSILNSTIGMKIFNSFWISIVATLFCILIAYPFTYFLNMSKSNILKTVSIALITAPIWLSLLVKLIGLKTFFDVINGEINSTYGHIYTIIGLVYVYLPFMMLPIYNSLSTMPKNLVNASYDLGRGYFYTFFMVVVPYTKNALLSGITLVFLSSFTSVAISTFLNNSNSATLIGEEIAQQGQAGIANQIQLSRASTLTLVISLILIAMYALFVLLPKLWKFIYFKQYKKKKKERKHENI